MIAANGLTAEQQARLGERYCRAGHRFDGANWPTPDGACPLCVDPDLKRQIDEFWRDALSRCATPSPLLESVPNTDPALVLSTTHMT